MLFFNLAFLLVLWRNIAINTLVTHKFWDLRVNKSSVERIGRHMSHFICIKGSVIMHLLRDLPSLCVDKTCVRERRVHVQVSRSDCSFLRGLDLVGRSLDHRRLRSIDVLLVNIYGLLALGVLRSAFRVFSRLGDWLLVFNHRLKGLSSFQEVVWRFRSN